jgi:diguanylate cyclase (GGDEF)-like protein
MDEMDKPQRPPLVLVADDQEWSARSLDSHLGPNGFAVLRAHTVRQAIDLARDTRPDAIIVDLRLPDLGGIEVCRTLRNDPRTSAATPIILTTSGSLSRAQCIDALTAGAWEVYTQPLDGEQLLLKLKTLMRAKQEVDRLRAESLVDDATGLYNLRGLAQRAREIGADAYRRQSPLACIAVASDPTGPDGGADGDADAADDLAQRIAAHLGQVCRSCGRTSDAVGRLSRTDLGIIAPSTARDGAERLVARLLELLKTRPLAIGGRTREVEVRIGLSAVSNFAESPIDAVELLLRAERALRHARNSGARRIVAFDDVPATVIH